MAYDILVLSGCISQPGQHVLEFFNADFLADGEQLNLALAAKKYRALVLDAIAQPQTVLAQCEALLADGNLQGIPVVLLTSNCTLQDKLKAFELGCDDFIDAATPADEICARITKSVFHQIANDQLSQRLQQATETARSAMLDACDLDANIQFLLQVHQCDNLDQLGQQFFITIERFGLSCSLQMRSIMGVKDMEAHGMAKDLESQLLMQLKDQGRFVDFGRRTIINYERVSLLIRNMPEDDLEKYGAIKNSALRMVQGVNARMEALEHQYRHLQNHQSLNELAAVARQCLQEQHKRWQSTVAQMESAAATAVHTLIHRMPHWALDESDERFVDELAEDLLSRMHELTGNAPELQQLLSRLEGACGS